jgi:taurine dioxygenase
MQTLLEPMHAVHDLTLTTNFDNNRYDNAEEIRRKNPPIAHPVVKVHPETGRKALYVSERVRNIVGLSEEESRPLLRFLTQHAVRYEFCYRHRWSVHDLLVWDNRCLMHLAVGDFDQEQTRYMLRTSVNGPKSGYLYTGEAPAAVPA